MKGVVAMKFAFPIVLAGLGAGAVTGFRMTHRQHLKKRNSQVGTGMILIAFMALSGCDFQSSTEVRETGGDYGPVTHDILAGARFTGRTGRDRSYDDLQWEFGGESFLITAGENGLPPVLADRLLPDGVKAAEISGKWTVADDVITFTEITADGELIDQPPRTLRTFLTPLLRIEAGQQYKFAMQSTSKPASQSAEAMGTE